MRSAIIFAASVLYVFILAGAASAGGWFLVSVPVVLWGGASLLDMVCPTNEANPALSVEGKKISYYQWIILLWLPIQLNLIFGGLAVVAQTEWFGTAEAVGLMICVGIGTGTFGVVYAHELMHRRDKMSKIAAEILLITVCYGHFMTEHLRSHHRYVGTPRDPATSRYNESAYHFLRRVIPESIASAWQIEAERLKGRGKPVASSENPFWRYFGGAMLCIAAAALIAGSFGVILFLIQCFIAIMLTEMINYIQHYGLTRKHLGQGVYEHMRQRHSWNAPYPATTALLINLQLHSDHHFKPKRSYPLLQTYSDTDAPRLPYGYPVMVGIAFSPQLWRSVMNRRVRRWRAEHYPEITDWKPYDSMTLPMPR